MAGRPQSLSRVLGLPPDHRECIPISFISVLTWIRPKVDVDFLIFATERQPTVLSISTVRGSESRVIDEERLAPTLELIVNSIGYVASQEQV